MSGGARGTERAMRGREARANGDERAARTGGESGREPPPNEGSGTRPRARRGTPSHERAPRPPRRSHDRRAASSPDTTATRRQHPLLPSLLSPSLPPLLSRRGIGKSRDAPAVPGAGQAGGRARREAEREATGDGRPAGTTEPPQSGRGARDGRAGDGGGRTGKATRQNPATHPYRDAARATRSQQQAHAADHTGRGRAGGCGRGSRAGGGRSGPTPKHTGKRGATSGRRGNHPRPPRAGSEDREPAGGRPRQRGAAGDRTAADPRREAEDEDMPNA